MILLKCGPVGSSDDSGEAEVLDHSLPQPSLGTEPCIWLTGWDDSLGY
jgi:hypothetical protein